MSLVISKVFTYDEDAGNYIQAVEAADGQALEAATRQAINNFVLGCKADGIWSAIKASCILAGARTLNGALVPLVGTAPTNFNFVAGDYNRKTGLIGNGSTKYLNSNRNNNSDPQNNHHLAAFPTILGTGALIGSRNSATPLGASQVNYSSNTLFFASRLTTSLGQTAGAILTNRIKGASRSQPSDFTYRCNSASFIVNDTSAAPSGDSINIFNRGGILDSYATHRLAFYSIGESLDLQKLDSRVTDLITAFGAAIP